MPSSLEATLKVGFVIAALFHTLSLITPGPPLYKEHIAHSKIMEQISWLYHAPATISKNISFSKNLGILSTFRVCDLVKVFELKSLFFLAKALVDIYGLSLNVSWELPEIAPVCSNKSRLHKLAACIVSPQQCLLLGFSSQDSLSGESRSKLLDKVQKFLPPTVMIPERRSEHLVEQALTVQREACAFHNSLDSSISLYSDHRCGKYHIPSETLQVNTPRICARLIWSVAEHIDLEGLNLLLADDPEDPLNIIITNTQKVLFDMDSSANTSNRLQDV
ncbi:hypothetical protein GIB67_017713 [Kingdonia uniflora]|uniref:Uncharacterized protein n=1 Tax=Kingdonia uniflora TaxID=39325 RepID=A0A7J7NA33_9MAGN|nr:hypothetical protein GIB67_017713 [Kingdonia uniflora]